MGGGGFTNSIDLLVIKLVTHWETTYPSVFLLAMGSTNISPTVSFLPINQDYGQPFPIRFNDTVYIFIIISYFLMASYTMGVI